LAIQRFVVRKTTWNMSPRSITACQWQTDSQFEQDIPSQNCNGNVHLHCHATAWMRCSLGSRSVRHS